MKVFISADIEGVAGTTVWDETIKSKGDYLEFANQMTLEVNAACEAVNEIEESEIWIKDAHDSGRNITHKILPKNTMLIRDWEGGLLSMVQGLDETFDALIFIGYHSPAGSNRSPLAHTLTGSYNYIKFNGEKISEFHIYSYASAYFNVPIVFLSGDVGMCEIAKKFIPDIEVVAVKEGKGKSTINIHPDVAIERIKERVGYGIQNKDKCYVDLPKEFEIIISYKNHTESLKASHYPGAYLISPHEVGFNTTNYMEVLRFLMFA